MGQGITDWGGTELVAALFGLGPAIPGFWVGLLSDEAGEAMTGSMAADLEPPVLVPDPESEDETPVLPTGYARQFIGLGEDNWALDSDTVTNLAELPFPLPTADWGMVSHWALFDAATLGNLYCWSELADPAVVEAAWQLVVPEGALVVAFASLDDTYIEP